MQKGTFAALRGYVTIQVKGKRLEAFMNEASRMRLFLWDARYKGEALIELTILVRDFFRLRPVLKQTGCRVHVVSRHGFPFFLDKLGRRKFFAVGLAGFIIGLYMLSSIIWQVKVEGIEKLSTYEVLQAARSEGIKPYQWKFRLKDSDTLARSIQSKLPRTAWVGVEIHGTQLVIRIVESTMPEQRELLSPRHLVASKSAVITSIRAEKGRPLVKLNSYVKKGDVLISGIIGSDVNGQMVPATGQVMGIVWYTSQIEAPLTQTYKTYTGESYKRFYLVFGSRALQITGYGKKGYETFETTSNRKTLQWQNYGLPVGWLHEKVMEVRLVEKPLEQQEAIRIGLEHANADLLLQTGRDSRVTEQNILHQKIENGKVYMEVQYAVEESIAQEQPIIGQGE